MKKFLALLASLLVVVASGCSNCKDGMRADPLGGGIMRDSQTYSACNRGCVKKGKRCDCSSACPCWREHGSAGSNSR